MLIFLLPKFICAAIFAYFTLLKAETSGGCFSFSFFIPAAMLTVQLLKHLLIYGFLLICGWIQPELKRAVFIAQKPVTAAQLIAPGKSIGQTKLLEDAKVVFKRLGKPDSGDAAMGKSLSTWYANHNPKGYQTQIFCSRKMGSADETISRVIQIRITSPYFKTTNGIGVGSTLKQINASFTSKKTSSYQENKQTFFVYDSVKGIAFEVSAGGKCVGIIVHLLKDYGGTTYLPFHYNQKMLVAQP